MRPSSSPDLGVTGFGSGTRNSWDKTATRESLMFKIRSIRYPPRPARTAARSSTSGLQSECPALVARGQARYLLGEGRLRAGRVLAVQAAYGQVDAQRAACERGVGEAPRKRLWHHSLSRPHPVHPAGSPDLVRARTTNAASDTSTEATCRSDNCDNRLTSSTEHNHSLPIMRTGRPRHRDDLRLRKSCQSRVHVYADRRRRCCTCLRRTTAGSRTRRRPCAASSPARRPRQAR